MTEQQSYREVMKATSIFGGVQVFTTLIGVVRSKFIAVLLGPLGFGIYGLLSSTTAMIAGFTNLGLETSAVKDVSAAYVFGNKIRISILAVVIRRLVWITGLIAALLTLVFSSLLSQLTFGNSEYTFAFIWLSVSLLLNQLSIGESILLRGLRRIQFLARAGMMGSLLGLLFTIPVYYFWGVKGIVPGIIISSVVAFLLNRYYTQKVGDIQPIPVSRLRTIAESKDMVKMGFIISISSMVTLLTAYIVRVYVSNTGGVDQVGLYFAGFTIITTYVGIIFNAMATDYYPRLSATVANRGNEKLVINHQAEIALLILAPIILLFLVFGNYIIILLYSSEFTPINLMVQWAALGMFFKAASWVVAFLFLAKGASKLFLVNEIVGNAYILVLNIAGYHFGGLTGLGISFLLSYCLYLVQVYVVARVKYNFSFFKGMYRIFGLQLLSAVLCFVAMLLIPKPWAYAVGLVFVAFSSVFSFRELNRRLDIASLLKTVINRSKNE
jgi:O-antigen/teichoic acid export membrane protein